MQSEVPALPVMCSDGHKRSTRKANAEVGCTSIESKNHTQCKSAPFLLSNRKQLNPILGGPYKKSMRVHCSTDSTKAPQKNPVGQRIISAKTLRVKELQNQLSDAHYHLNELANENRLLKVLQKRQDSALKRYEGTNAELPRIINSHHEELKVLQIKYKRLRLQHKQTCDLLKEKENEVHSLQSQNKHLLQLSKDRHLGEREKLQMQVSDLNHRIERQQETIQSLNRKLTLETKSLKHQLHLEMSKHKDTQKLLHGALEKLKNMEELMDNREKRLYQNGQLPTFNKKQSMTSQSLTNLGNSNLIKSSSKSRESQNDFKNKSLPKLSMNDSAEMKALSAKTEFVDSPPKTETMASLQQVRKFRLSRSPLSRHNSARALMMEHDQDIRGNERSKVQKHQITNNSARTDINRVNSQDLADEEIKSIMEQVNKRNEESEKYQLPEELIKEFGYSSSDDDTNGDDDNGKKKDILPTSKSRDLHTRLVNGLIDSSSFQIDSSQKIQRNSPDEAKVLYKRVREISEIKDVISTSDSDSEIQGIMDKKESEDRKNPSSNREKSIEKSSAERTSVNFEYENSQERLLNITKSWTHLQEKIKREREISERQLRDLEDDNIIEKKASDNEITLPSSEKLLRYFERDKDNEDVQERISTSLVYSRKTSLDRPQSSAGPLHEVQGNTESNLMLNGESSSREDAPTEIPIRKPVSKSSGTLSDDKQDMNQRKLPKNSQSATNNYDVMKKESESQDSSSKAVNFNKQKLLAAMKAIDDNENIEFIPSQKTSRSGSISLRSQVTENLYRGLPTHARKKDDIIKDIFGDTKVENKIRSGCSKLH